MYSGLSLPPSLLLSPSKKQKSGGEAGESFALLSKSNEHGCRCCCYWQGRGRPLIHTLTFIPRGISLDQILWLRQSLLVELCSISSEEAGMRETDGGEAGNDRDE